MKGSRQMLHESSKTSSLAAATEEEAPRPTSFPAAGEVGQLMSMEGISAVSFADAESQKYRDRRGQCQKRHSQEPEKTAELIDERFDFLLLNSFCLFMFIIFIWWNQIIFIIF